MRRRIVLAASLLSVLSSGACAGETKPDAFVTSLYGAPEPSGHYKHTVNIVDHVARITYASERLAGIFDAMDKRTAEDGSLSLDFDPVSNSQDEPDVHDLKVKTESVSADKAVVIADFQSYDNPQHNVLRYELVREYGDWRVDDIAGSGSGASDWLLSDIASH